MSLRDFEESAAISTNLEWEEWKEEQGIIIGVN
jgi:hypothetical protein